MTSKPISKRQFKLFFYVFVFSFLLLSQTLCKNTLANNTAVLTQKTVEKPLVLVLQLATTQSEQQTEARYIEEMELILDDVKLKKLVPPDIQFISAPLGEQIHVVRKLIKTHSAMAAIWMEKGPNNGIWLHLLAASEKRAITKTVEMPLVKGIETDLAIGARELLSAAFIFAGPTQNHPATAPKDQHKNTKPTTNKENATSRKTDASTTSNKPANGRITATSTIFQVEARLIGGLSSRTGPAMMLGGAAGITYFLKDHFGLGANVIFLGGFPGSTQTSAFALSSQIGLAYRLPLSNRFALLPRLGVQLKWLALSVKSTNNTEQTFHAHHYGGYGTLSGFLAISKKIGLYGGGGLSIFTEVEEIKNNPDDRALYQTPHLFWSAHLGLFF